MKRLIKYNSILSFDKVSRNLKNHCSYHNLQVPTVNVHLTEKIHGTNGAVCYSEPDGFWVQSRENIITVEKDNAGCALFCMKREKQWMKLIHELAEAYDIDLTQNIISIYFEFAGGKIQSNSALTGVEKLSIIFEHFKVSPLEPIVKDNKLVSVDNQSAIWLPTKNKLGEWIDLPEDLIYNINKIGDVKTFIVDFNNPKLYFNQLNEIVQKIEQESIVGKNFDKNNIGEGVVGTFTFNDMLYKFKVKGEKHTKSKIKKLKVVDEEFEKKKVKFAEKVVTPSRCEQGWQKVFGIENEKHEPNIKKIGEFLKWIHEDILKEHSDDLIDMELEYKKVNSTVTFLAREWFLEQIEEYNLKG